MRLRGFHPEAEAELEEAARWYEEQRGGLGVEFLAAVREAVQEVTVQPTQWPRCTRRSRQYRLKRFPYAVVYRLVGEEVILLAVAHLKRKPRYWRKRER